MHWTCTGDVRGNCGHRHRTLEAAERCCMADHAGVRHAYPSTFPTLAYSDRHPVEDPGDETDLPLELQPY